jgi:hypothetical protein
LSQAFFIDVNDDWKAGGWPMGVRLQQGIIPLVLEKTEEEGLGNVDEREGD